MGRKSHADQIVKLALDSDITFHVDQFSRYHLKLPGEPNPVKLRSKDVRTWLSSLFWEKMEKTPGSYAITNALDVLEGMARKKAESFSVDENFGKPVDDDKSQSQRLIELAFDQDITLYRDERKEYYIFYKQEGVGGYENHPIDSSHIENWLTNLLWTQEYTVPNSESIKNVQRVLKANAYNGEITKLYNRVAPDGKEGIYIDMADDAWNVINVTAQGWTFTSTPPRPIFRRYSHQKPLPTPIAGGDAAELFRYANITDPYHQILYATAIVCSLIPEIEHPVFNVFGPYGSGKSLLLEIVKKLVDPSVTPLLSLHKDDKELIKNLDDQYCVFFDNISYLTSDISDILCRAVTGMGFSLRRLWTNNETFIRQFKRVVGLNGINIPAEQGDLLSRCINLETSDISEVDMIPRKKMEGLLQERTPYLLGAFLDVLVKTLAVQSTVKISEVSRMGDYSEWGYAAAQALGYDPDDFLKAHKENRGHGSVDAVSASFVGPLVQRFMEDRKHEVWEGTPQALYDEMVETAKKHSISTTQRRFPKAANYLSRELNKLSPDLRKLGFLVSRQRTNTARLIKIQSSSYKPDNEPLTLKTYVHDADPEKDAPRGATESGLGKDMKVLLGRLIDLENERGEAVPPNDLWEAIKHRSWRKEHFDRILMMLISDGAVYEPRPGFYRRTT